MASIAEVIPPPAESPVMQVLSVPRPCVLRACSTIEAIDWTSPCPRVVSPLSTKVKQELALLPEVCCG